MFTPKHTSFVDDILKKSQQGFAATVVFVGVGGAAAATLLTLRGGPMLPQHDERYACPQQSVCIVERDPAFHRVEKRWYAASERCASGLVPVVPMDTPQRCDTSLQGGAVPNSLLGECWRCETR